MPLATHTSQIHATETLQKTITRRGLKYRSIALRVYIYIFIFLKIVVLCFAPSFYNFIDALMYCRWFYCHQVVFAKFLLRWVYCRRHVSAKWDCRFENRWLWSWVLQGCRQLVAFWGPWPRQEWVKFKRCLFFNTYIYTWCSTQIWWIKDTTFLWALHWKTTGGHQIIL